MTEWWRKSICLQSLNIIAFHVCTLSPTLLGYTTERSLLSPHCSLRVWISGSWSLGGISFIFSWMESFKRCFISPRASNPWMLLKISGCAEHFQKNKKLKVSWQILFPFRSQGLRALTAPWRGIFPHFHSPKSLCSRLRSFAKLKPATTLQVFIKYVNDFIWNTFFLTISKLKHTSHTNASPSTPNTIHLFTEQLQSWASACLQNTPLISLPLTPDYTTTHPLPKSRETAGTEKITSNILSVIFLLYITIKYKY